MPYLEVRSSTLETLDSEFHLEPLRIVTLNHVFFRCRFSRTLLGGNRNSLKSDGGFDLLSELRFLRVCINRRSTIIAGSLRGKTITVLSDD